MAILVVAAALVAAGFRLLQLRRLHEEWANANPDLWRVQFPEEVRNGVSPPPVTSWIGMVGFAIALVVLIALVATAAFAWLRGDDAPHFDDQDPEEQDRRADAGDRLERGLPGAPPVANTLSTRAGRRAARRQSRAD